jgi:hypothetical protein
MDEGWKCGLESGYLQRCVAWPRLDIRLDIQRWLR